MIVNSIALLSHIDPLPKAKGHVAYMNNESRDCLEKTEDSLYVDCFSMYLDLVLTMFAFFST